MNPSGITDALTPEQYAYTVEVLDQVYDVYYFEKDGKPGSIAFRLMKANDRPLAEIAVFCAGHISKEEAFDRISKGNN